MSFVNLNKLPQEIKSFTWVIFFFSEKYFSSLVALCLLIWPYLNRTSTYIDENVFIFLNLYTNVPDNNCQFTRQKTSKKKTCLRICPTITIKTCLSRCLSNIYYFKMPNICLLGYLFRFCRATNYLSSHFVIMVSFSQENIVLHSSFIKIS